MGQNILFKICTSKTYHLFSHYKMMISPFLSFFFAHAPRGCNQTDFNITINCLLVLAAITPKLY